MASDFDPDDKFSWFFGPMSRDETNDMLTDQSEGVFLVRESQTLKGDFVLCVKEDSKVSHYLINRIQKPGGSIWYKIGEQEFPDMPSLLRFYKKHYLETSSLIRPAPREKVRCKYDFAGRDPEDLPFTRGDVLEIIMKDEEKWWTARNSNGVVGQIPVPYVEKCTGTDGRISSDGVRPDYNTPTTGVKSKGPNVPRVPSEITLPAQAKVIQERVPNAYDKTQLKLEKGDIVTVTQMHPNGQWEGELKGKKGFFPFTHVTLIDPNNPNGEDGDIERT
ncbi:adapter molecule Crk-like [Liolophura sinensis]|uniref:adapter molecule Crk-like n=1 Tax=Liolophura sinensis TaxID=3198878 RepID=UPI0031592854